MPTGGASQPLDPVFGPQSGDLADVSDVMTGASEGPSRWLAVLLVMVGVVLGAAAMHALDGRTRASTPALDLRLSMGAHAGALSEVEGDPVVSVPLVIDNLGDQRVTLTEIRVTGPGASLYEDLQQPAPLPLPAVLVPDFPVDTRIDLRSDCAVGVRPTPVVTLVLVDAAGDVREVPTEVPGLGAVWGQTLVPLSCESL